MIPPPRWRKVDQLLCAALDQPADERAHFVTDLIDEDVQLGGEVTALLDAQEGAARFLGAPCRMDALATRDLFLLIAVHALQVSNEREECES